MLIKLNDIGAYVGFSRQMAVHNAIYNTVKSQNCERKALISHHVIQESDVANLHLDSTTTERVPCEAVSFKPSLNPES